MLGCHEWKEDDAMDDQVDHPDHSYRTEVREILKPLSTQHLEIDKRVNERMKERTKGRAEKGRKQEGIKHKYMTGCQCPGIGFIFSASHGIDNGVLNIRTQKIPNGGISDCKTRCHGQFC